MKRQIDELRNRSEIIARENERLRQECDEREHQMLLMNDERKEQAKRHIEEIENLKLAHQQEIYMLKRMQQK